MKKLMIFLLALVAANSLQAWEEHSTVNGYRAYHGPDEYLVSDEFGDDYTPDIHMSLDGFDIYYSPEYYGPPYAYDELSPAAEGAHLLLDAFGGYFAPEIYISPHGIEIYH